MKHLTDFEELLAKIKSEESRVFIAEAVQCYTAGAYRGAIVIASIALFEDLRRKLSELASINPDARSLCDEIERRASAQELYESYLSDQLVTIGILSNLEKSILNRLREHRNKAAHPTGHAPSAEEARYVLHEIVTGFLERPTLYATQRVDELRVRLKSDNYFPSDQITSIQSIVAEELANLHPGAFPYLVKELRIAHENTSGKENQNCRFFLSGLAALATAPGALRDALRKHYVEKVSEAFSHGSTLLACASNNPALFSPAGDAIFSRFKNILETQIVSLDHTLTITSQNHPCQVFDAFAKKLGAGFIEQYLHEQLLLLLKKRPFEIMAATIGLNIPSLKTSYLEILSKRAGSTVFDTANEAAAKIAGLDAMLADKLTPAECLSLIGSFIKSANHGAWSANTLCEQKFASIGGIKQKARAELDGMTAVQYTKFAEFYNVVLETKEVFQTTYF